MVTAIVLPVVESDRINAVAGCEEAAITENSADSYRSKVIFSEKETR